MKLLLNSSFLLLALSLSSFAKDGGDDNDKTTSSKKAATPTKFEAAADAGLPTSFVFPPPGATQDPIAFPPQNGPPGATPTGDEAEAIATAPAAALLQNFFPLLNPGTLDKKPTEFNTVQRFGNLAPWFSVPSSGSPQVPEGCDITQVHLLHRHGARYPTAGAPPAAFAARLASAVANGTGFTATGPLSFLNDYQYKLGAEILTPFGRQQLYELGTGFRVKYGNLLKKDANATLPVFRTTSEDRMLKSALNFAAGFFGIPDYQTDYSQSIIVEAPNFNNTLAPYETCENSNLPVGEFGNGQSAKWDAIYLAGALKRFQPFIKGLNLTITDVVGMQTTCAYETVALGYSAFCDLFTAEEWDGFEYALDLGFWYSNSFGNPTSAAMGIGWVQELVSRLTETPIAVHNSTTNSTLDNSRETFPFGQGIYVDATHDTIVSAIIVALNFTSFAAGGPLPTDHIPKDQTFIVNQISPFGTNLVGQVLACPGSSSKPTHIRWLLNDAVVPLTGIKGCTKDTQGLCELPTFISAMQERIRTIDFAFDCLANYTVADPAAIVDGRPPLSVRPPDEKA